LLAHGRWFSPDTPASSTTKTGRHDIVESGAKTPKIKIKNQSAPCCQNDTIMGKPSQHRVVKMTPSWENHHSTVTGAPANHRLRRTLFYMQRTFTSLKLSKYFSNNYLIHNFQVSRLRNAFCHRSPNAKYL
jgi:hypothetical protein